MMKTTTHCDFCEEETTTQGDHRGTYPPVPGFEFIVSFGGTTVAKPTVCASCVQDAEEMAEPDKSRLMKITVGKRTITCRLIPGDSPVLAAFLAVPVPKKKKKTKK